MKYFFSIDWGTSALRVRLIEIRDDILFICSETNNNFGCAHVYDLFKSQNEISSQENYFLAFLRPFLVIPPSISNQDSLLVVISGMATSSIGIREMPYATLPISTNGYNLKYDIIPKTGKLNHDVLLISGVCDVDDVMRGEEVQLLGLLQQQSKNDEALFILPGTHSKHIYVKNNAILSFKTYITGELFQLIHTYSLLKNSIKKTTAIDREAFRAGLKLSKGNILHEVFKIRSSTLLKKTENTANYSLLSGLIIGIELRDIIHSELPFFLCAHGNLMQSYVLAIEELSMLKRCTVILSKQVDEAVIYGHKIMAERLWNKLI